MFRGGDDQQHVIEIMINRGEKCSFSGSTAVSTSGLPHFLLCTPFHQDAPRWPLSDFPSLWFNDLARPLPPPSVFVGGILPTCVIDWHREEKHSWLSNLVSFPSPPYPLPEVERLPVIASVELNLGMALWHPEQFDWPLASHRDDGQGFSSISTSL